MSRQAKMFNRKASDPKNKPDHILETLELQPGQTVADIGAGGGYFSLRFADAVRERGKVYAVDTNAKFLEFIRDQAQERGLPNLETFLATEETLVLPAHSLDLIFMRNISHHLQNRAKYFRELRRLLTPHGRIALIEYSHPRRLSFRGISGHYVPKEILLKEMREAGYTLQKDLSFLPEQSFTIFSSKKEGRKSDTKLKQLEDTPSRARLDCQNTSIPLENRLSASTRTISGGRMLRTAVENFF